MKSNVSLKEQTLNEKTIDAESRGNGNPGSASELKKKLEDAGFFVQDGKLECVDVFKMVEDGVRDTCHYQNLGAPYLTLMLPLAPGQEDNCQYFGGCNNSQDDKLFIDFRIRPDEAIVLVGKTPPKCVYFSYDPYINYRWSEEMRQPVKICGNYGDTINPLVIKTDSTGDDPFNRNTMIIMTADKGVAEMVKNAAEDAGYSSGIVNEYPIPSQILNLGLDEKSDTLTFLHRFAYPDNDEKGKDYLDDPQMSVFRVTPNSSTKPDRYEIPKGRVRGTGDYKELTLSHTVEQLRQAILEVHGKMAFQDLTPGPLFQIEDGLDAIQQMSNGFGVDRDAAYLKCSDFQLADDPDEFVIAYGINHAAICKATYSNITVYGKDKENGVASIWNNDYAGTADDYLPGNPDAKFLYVWKFARNSNGDPHTTEVPFNEGIRGIDLDQTMCLGFRAYLEKETKTGPNIIELYYDRTIKFSKKP